MARFKRSNLDTKSPRDYEAPPPPPTAPAPQHNESEEDFNARAVWFQANTKQMDLADSGTS